jgi:hypothetical protein
VARLGIEGIFHTRYTACVNGQWQALLSYLVSEDLCAPDVRTALLNYTGYNLEKTLHHRIYIRGLNHVKLEYRQGKPLAAKVYFGAIQKPITAIPRFAARSAPAVETGSGDVAAAPRSAPGTIGQTLASAVD